MTTPAFNARVAQCPGCGAELVFKVGASRVIVCEYCNYGVARTDRGLESLGKVADVIPTGAHLVLGATGTFEGVGFRLVGRLQLEWQQGVWDEWYAAFDDGRWGWLAEAQGRYYVSFRASERTVPPYAAMKPGRRVALHGLGTYVVSDVRHAKYVAARGELPDELAIGATDLPLVDLSGAGGAFATLDYGGAEEPDKPAIFAGREVRLEELAIQSDGVAHHVERVRTKARALTCPKCSAPVPLQVPDQAMRVTCAHCSSLLDATQGDLRFLAELKKPDMRFQLGAKATFAGEPYLLVGWMERSCKVEGETYFWHEYLLYHEKTGSYRYLVVSDGHWSFVEPIAPGDVEVGPSRATYKAQTFRRFSSVEASVRRVWGEFPWAVAAGERAHAVDFVAPPEGLSEERTGNEVSWSYARYVEPEDIARAFGSKQKLPRPRGVGAMQPNPHAKAARGTTAFGLVACLAALALFVFLSVRAPEQVVLQQDVRFTPGLVEGDAPPGTQVPPNTAVAFSEPFEIAKGGRNLRAQLSSDVDNAWVFVAFALINESTNEFTPFQLESSYYSGADSDGSWTEDERSSEEFLSSVPSGRYVLRMEAQWEQGRAPPAVAVRLTSGVARFFHFFLALVALAVFPLVVYLRKNSFEHRRWEESSEGGE